MTAAKYIHAIMALGSGKYCSPLSDFRLTAEPKLPSIQAKHSGGSELTHLDTVTLRLLVNYGNMSSNKPLIRITVEVTYTGLQILHTL